MDYAVNDQRLEITFRFDLNDVRVVEQLQFAHLVAYRFASGAEPEQMRHYGASPDDLGAYTIKAPSFRALRDAGDWCRAHLDDDGQVADSYVGALDHADPDGRCAREYLATMLSLPKP